MKIIDMTFNQLLDYITINDRVVTVHDLSNYKSGYQEEVPFEAEVEDVTTSMEIWVRSLVTGKIYELYPHQLEDEKDNSDTAGNL